MASVVQICNMALSHIGSEARVLSIDPPDGSVEAGHCATFYDPARTELLEPGSWAFSLRRAALAQADNTSTAWAYAYAKPSDCLRPVRVIAPTIGVTVFSQDSHLLRTDDRGCADFDMEGGVIYSNTPDAVLLYVRDVVDSGDFPASFTSALSYLLASYIAGPVIKGSQGMQVGDGMRQRAMSLADISATASANASSATESWASRVMAVRA